MNSTVVFVDSRVDNIQALAAAMPAGAQIVVLNGGSAGLAQIAQYLDGRSGIASIHVISHGSAGTLYLGSTAVSGETIGQYADDLRAIGRSLTTSGDILLYGCNVAADIAGTSLVAQIAALTGADVAASSDLTGGTTLGGDWDLEAATGTIESATIGGGQDWLGLLAANTAPSFSVGSARVSTDFGAPDLGQGVVVQADGRIIVAGTNGSDFAIARYTATGTLDASFSGDGRATTDFVGSADFGRAVRLQADGKIVVAGNAFNGSDEDFAVSRYNADGSLDTTFGQNFNTTPAPDGKLLTDFGGAHNPDLATALAIQADGKLVVVGSANSDFAVARYNTNGTLDTTFSGDGQATSSFTFVVPGESAQAVAIQGDGRIVVAGWYFSGANANDFALLRYNTDGTLDATFDGDGRVMHSLGNLGDQAFAIAIQADGRIVVAGVTTDADMDLPDTQQDFAVVRYNTNGSLDATFGSGGVVRTDFGSNDVAQALALQADGRIVVTGYSDLDFAAARYNTNGTLDTTFNGDGRLETDFAGGSFDRGQGVFVQPNGKIVLAGRTTLGFDSDFAVLRYNADGSLDAGFGPVANTLNGAPTFTEAGAAVVLDSDVRVFDAELGALGNYGGATLTLSRQGGANAQDVFSAAGSALGALVQSAALVYDGATVGTVTTNSGGTLVLTFNANATQYRVDGVLQSIAYSNSSSTPPGSVQINWVFSDANSGAQGTGGALAATGSTTVSIINISEGTSGADTIIGDDNRNILRGLDGDDYLLGRAGVDVLQGGNNNDRLEGGIGADALDGGGGFDYARYSNAAAEITVDLAFSILNSGEAVGDTFLSIEGVIGSAFGDQIFGDDNVNDLSGDGGDDTILGRAGNDNLHGGANNDILEGGTGADNLDGGAGTDLASYANADAPVIVDLLTPSLNTGDAEGDVYLTVEGLIGSNFTDQLFGNNGSNDISGLDGDDYLAGRLASDVLRGDFGNDFLDGGGGADTLIGGDGFDYARYSRSISPVIIDLASPNLNTGEGIGDTFNSVESLIGTNFNDQLSGDDETNDIAALGGDDIVFGRGAHDNLQGGNGNDTLNGGEEGDRLAGGAGTDVASYDGAAGFVIADLATRTNNRGEATADVYESIEGLVGSNGGDQLFGDAGVNMLSGANGDDFLFGRAGVDTLQGGNGQDLLEGGAGADVLVGGNGFDYARYSTAGVGVTVDFNATNLNTFDATGDSYDSIEGIVGSELGDRLSGNNLQNDIAGLGGDDILAGRGGDDNLQGNNGSDTLNGGANADRLEGGAGNDIFVFNRGEAAGDRIADFNGNGAGAGDQIVFQGYGTAVQGATFVQLDPTHWQVNSSDGTVHETIEFMNGAPVHATDYTFIV